jgi:hypothetical protein
MLGSKQISTYSVRECGGGCLRPEALSVFASRNEPIFQPQAGRNPMETKHSVALNFWRQLFGR